MEYMKNFAKKFSMSLAENHYKILTINPNKAPLSVWPPRKIMIIKTKIIK
jgi:hypothetical protein